MRRQASKPSMPGIMTSSSTTSTRSRAKNVQRFLAAVGGEHFEILSLQPRFEQLHIGEDVIDDEYAGGHGLLDLRSDTGDWGRVLAEQRSVRRVNSWLDQ